MMAEGNPSLEAIPNRFTELAETVEQARVAAVAALAIQDAMTADSQEVANSILPKWHSEGSAIREYWPLVNPEVVLSRSVARKQSFIFMRGRADDQTAEEAELSPRVTLFATDYFDADLASLYRHTLDVSLLRAFLIADLDRWANGMAQKGWPVVFAAELDRPMYSSVWVHEDKPGIRKALQDVDREGLKKIDQDFRIERGLARYLKHRVAGGLTGKGRTSLQTERGFVEYTDRKTKKLIEDMLSSRNT